MDSQVISIPKPLLDGAMEVALKLRKSGYTSEGISVVLDLLAHEHEVGSDRYNAYVIAKGKVI